MLGQLGGAAEDVGEVMDQDLLDLIERGLVGFGEFA